MFAQTFVSASNGRAGPVYGCPVELQRDGEKLFRHWPVGTFGRTGPCCLTKAIRRSAQLPSRRFAPTSPSGGEV